MSELEVPAETERPSLRRRTLGIMFKAFVAVAIIQAVVAVVWSYNELWVVLLWVMIGLIAAQVILVTAILLRDWYELTQVSRHIHEEPPGGPRGDS